MSMMQQRAPDAGRDSGGVCVLRAANLIPGRTTFNRQPTAEIQPDETTFEMTFVMRGRPYFGPTGHTDEREALDYAMAAYLAARIIHDRDGLAAGFP